MMLFILALLTANVASLGYVFRAKIRAKIREALDDIEDTSPRYATPHRDDTTRLAVYHEILAACGLDAMRCEAGAIMLAQQSLHMRGVLLTTGLRPFVASLKKSDDRTIRNYITRNGG